MKRVAGLVTVLFLASVCVADGPIDTPASTEPRVEVGISKAPVGFVSSEGVGKAYSRVHEGDALYSRDVLVALPGFQVNVQPTSRNVNLLMWGNMPELSSSPVLESAVILHDTRAYDLDLTLLRGRVVLTNTRAKGAAKVWLRTGLNAVEFVLNEPGAQVALEIYGRWPAGTGFHRHRKAGDDRRPRPGVLPRRQRQRAVRRRAAAGEGGPGLGRPGGQAGPRRDADEEGAGRVCRQTQGR
jgi:hypothetical protein